MKCKKCNKELNKEDVKVLSEDYIDENDNPFEITDIVTSIKKDSVEIGISALCHQMDGQDAKVFCKHCGSLIGSFEIEQNH